jgi:hypothetical protein
LLRAGAIENDSVAPVMANWVFCEETTDSKL